MAAGVLLMTGACTGGSSLSADDFAEGTCQQVAEPVIAVDEAIIGLRDGDSTVAETAVVLEEQQAILLQLRPDADRELEPVLGTLTDAIGLFRIGADAGTDDGRQGQAVSAAVDDVAAACQAAG